MAPFGTDSLRAVGSAGRIWSWGYIVSTTFCQYITSAGFLIIKWTRYYANFSNLFLEWNSTCFGQFLCPSSGVFHCTHSNGMCRRGNAESLWAGANAPAHKLSANLYDIYHCCVYSGKLL